MNIRRLALLLAVVALLLTTQTGLAAVPQQTGCAAYYTVQPGDNLYRISLQYNVPMAALMAANGMYNPNFVYAGQTMCIPGASTTPPPQPSGWTTPPQPGCAVWYTVRFGDTLSGIAWKFGVPVYAIMQANNLQNPNWIYAGMILYIPCKAAPPYPGGGTSFPQWKGEYFNNPNLAGAPSVVRNDSAIAFNWGYGWPNPKISADNFSVRWTRTVYLNQGTYRFTVNVDDGARLFVDNVLVLDQWQPATGLTYIVDVPLGTGNHVIRMEYYEGTGLAYAYLTYALVSGTPPAATPIPPIYYPTPGPTPVTQGSAWTCTFYSNQELDGAVATVIEPALNFNWGGQSPYPGVPKNLWSMRCTSVQYFPSSGPYQFNARVDDGVRVFVDGNAVINAWFNQAGVLQTGTANLSAGPHNMTVEYYQFGHDSLLSVWWNSQ